MSVGCPSLEDVCHFELGYVYSFAKQVAVCVCARARDIYCAYVYVCGAAWSLTIARVEERRRGLFCIPHRMNYGRRGAVARRAERKHDFSLCLSLSLRAAEDTVEETEQRIHDRARKQADHKGNGSMAKSCARKGARRWILLFLVTFDVRRPEPVVDSVISGVNRPISRNNRLRSIHQYSDV